MSDEDQLKDRKNVQYHSASDVIDEQLTPGIPGRVPSHAAVSAALVKKQNVIANSDEIKEGIDHLYFTPGRCISAVKDLMTSKAYEACEKKQDIIHDSDEIKEGQKNQYFRAERALDAVYPFISAEIKSACEPKQNKIKDSDEIAEGGKNLYYTDKRARLACITPMIQSGNNLAPTSDAVSKVISLKQDIIKSSDDIAEGSQNKYFNIKVVHDLIEEATQGFVDQINLLKEKCQDLQDQVTALKPKWSDSFTGGNGTLTVITNVSHHGVRSQSVTFRNGVLWEITPKTSLKSITTSEET